ncbi:replication-relaxation family protein [Kitasatospora sp. NPDC056138]|uniref:replication-relaxation family protein n=1 Tax=Kitasatospora sp. NPDC056138 TaxID=3345724 RepID=UPI0035DDDC6C
MNHDQDDGQYEQHDGEQPAPRPGRINFRRSARNPNGSGAALRADVLAVLGVLKVVTYKQLHALIANDEYRDHHRTEHVAEAVRDLIKHKLVEERGRTSTIGALQPGARPQPTTRSALGARSSGPGEKIFGLTPAGLLAAAEALGDDREMGGHARGAGETGAPHAMLVNEFIISAVTGTTTHGAPPRTDDRQAPPRRALPEGPLPGGLDAWATEVAHPITGKQTVIPDAVVRLPEFGHPVLFVEVDRGTMTDINKVAGKLDNYHRWFSKLVKEGHHERPKFEIDYGSLTAPGYGYHHSDVPRPPVLFVFDRGLKGGRPRFTEKGLYARIDAFGAATRHHWEGRHHEEEGVEYQTFKGKIPVLATTTDRLLERGFLGPDTWWRYGLGTWTDLAHALDPKPDRDLIRKRRKARQDQERADAQAAAKAEQDALDAEQRAKLLAARAHNDALHPCYTCHGPLGGAHDSSHELDENSHPDRLECPSCELGRRAAMGRPIILELPTARALRRAEKSGPPDDDPWWQVRLLHAKRWPKQARSSGETPRDITQIPRGRSVPDKR